MPSPPIVFLLSVGLGAALFYWYRDIRAGRKLRRLVSHVKQIYPEAWAALPYLPRTLFPLNGLIVLHRSGAVVDANFERDYRDLMAARPSIWILVLGVAAILLIGLGVEFFDWRW